MPAMKSAPLPSRRKAWKALQAHYKTAKDLELKTLFAEDPQRGERMTVEGAGLFLDYSLPCSTFGQYSFSNLPGLSNSGLLS